MLQDNGIVELGPHELLVAKDGLYARLVRQQYHTLMPEPRVVLQTAS